MGFDFFFLFINRGVSIGGKGSTEFVVKGSHKELPQELIDKLKAICQVLYIIVSSILNHWLLRIFENLVNCCVWLVNDTILFGQDNMTMDYDERYIHGKPQNSFHKAVNIPDVIVFPRWDLYIHHVVCYF